MKDKIYDNLYAMLQHMQSLEGLSIKTFLTHFLAQIKTFTHADTGVIYHLHHNTQHPYLEAIAMQSAVIKRPKKIDLPFDKTSLAGTVAIKGRLMMLDDPYKSPHFDQSYDKAHGYITKGVLCFPIQSHHGKTLGVVGLASATKIFTQEDLNLVRMTMPLIGRAFERLLHDRELQDKNKKIMDLQKQTEDAFMTSVTLLARASELHDEDTGNHILRVNEYSYALAKALHMPAKFCTEIRYSAQLHDIGKMSVDSMVLKKEGPLTPDERAEMNRHTEYGYRILKDTPRLKMAADIAHCHHEKWRGGGYPRSIEGSAIPMAARIVQLADIYDALRSKRAYKPEFSHEKAVDIILNGDEKLDSSNIFDPHLLEVFKTIHPTFSAIWQSFL